MGDFPILFHEYIYFICVMDGKKKYTPGNQSVKLFDKLLFLNKVVIFKQLIYLIKLLFVEIAPDIPVSLSKAFTGNSGKRAFLYGAVITFIFCFVVPAIWTYANGTFIGENTSEHIYFIYDRHNIVLYILICPLYVGLGCWLAVTTITGWGKINDLKNSLLKEGESPQKTISSKTPILIFVILGMAFFLTTNYIYGVKELSVSGKDYWFFDEEHKLGALGVYYFLLNFALLVSVLLSLMFFMSLFTSVMNVADALEEYNGDHIEFKIFETKLASFTEGYLLAKGIVAALILNIWIWQKSPLGGVTPEDNTGTDNLILAGIFMTIIGGFLISLPRYYFELQWLRYKHRVGEIEDNTKGHHDIRSDKVTFWASILDTLIIGGFISAFWFDRILPTYVTGFFD